MLKNITTKFPIFEIAFWNVEMTFIIHGFNSEYKWTQLFHQLSFINISQTEISLSQHINIDIGFFGEILRSTLKYFIPTHINNNALFSINFTVNKMKYNDEKNSTFFLTQNYTFYEKCSIRQNKQRCADKIWYWNLW